MKILFNLEKIFGNSLCQHVYDICDICMFAPFTIQRQRPMSSIWSFVFEFSLDLSLQFFWLFFLFKHYKQIAQPFGKVQQILMHSPTFSRLASSVQHTFEPLSPFLYVAFIFQSCPKTTISLVSQQSLKRSKSQSIKPKISLCRKNLHIKKK